MTFNTQNILSTLNKSGLAKTSHFEVEVTGPSDVGLEREMLYRADVAEIPGRTVVTTEYKFGNYGPISKIPYNQLYADLTVQFLLSEDLREKEYFEIWQNKMIDTAAFQTGDSKFSNSYYNLKYYDEFVGTITLRQYSDSGKLRSIHTFMETYPIILQPITMSWLEDAPVKLSVTFAYKNYKVAFTKQDQPKLGRGFSFSIGPNGVAGNLRIPGIGSVGGSFGSGLKTVSGNIGPLSGLFSKVRKSI